MEINGGPEDLRGTRHNCGSVEIYHGNALAILPGFEAESVDAVITDPSHQGLKGQQAHIRELTQCLSDCRRIAREGAPVFVFTGWKQLPAITGAVQAAGFFWRAILVWHKVNDGPPQQKVENRPESEFVVYALKTKFPPNSNTCLPRMFSFYISQHENGHIHGSLPVKRMMILMNAVPYGGKVLDPFLCGGATGIAAKLTGRSCIGIESSEIYVRLALQTLSNTP